MNVNDVKVIEEDGFLSCSLMIKANSKIVKERIWTGMVTSNIMKQHLESDTDARLTMSVSLQFERNPLKEFKTARANVQLK